MAAGGLGTGRPAARASSRRSQPGADLVGLLQVAGSALGRREPTGRALGG